MNDNSPEHEAHLREIRDLWDAEAATFDDEPDHGLRAPEVRAAWTALLRDSLPATSLSILDIGCGTGSLSVLLAGLGHRVSGIDLSPVMLGRAQAKAAAAGYTIPFQLMDAARPQFEPRSFDAIVCRHLLWALPEPGEALNRWAGQLRPGGRLVLVEGYWHTGGGLHAEEIVRAMPAGLIDVTVRNLSDQPELWGGPVEDERYMVTAMLPARAPS